MSTQPIRMTLELLKLRTRVDPRSDCWIWTQCTQDKGYGRVRYRGRSYLAHRMAWQLAGKQVPTGRRQVIVRDCGEAACINPAHMRVVGKGDHIRQLTAEGVMSQGVRHALAVSKHVHARAKLDMTKAREIRALAGEGKPHHEIAQDFGISKSNVQKIVTHVTWREVGGWT